MTDKNLFSERNRDKFPIYLSIIKKIAHKKGYTPKIALEKIFEAYEKNNFGKKKKTEFGTISRYWDSASCKKEGGNKEIPAVFLETSMYALQIEKSDLLEELKKKYSHLTIYGVTFFFTKGCCQRGDAISDLSIVNERFGKNRKKSLRAVSLRKKIITDRSASTESGGFFESEDISMMQEVQFAEYVKSIIQKLPVKDCFFLVNCYELYFNISEYTESFIKEYLSFDTEGRREIREIFEKKNINGYSILTQLEIAEVKQEVSSLMALSNEFLTYENKNFNQITQEQIISTASEDIFDEWLMQAIEIYPKLDEKAFDVWIMFALLDERAQRKIWKEIEEYRDGRQFAYISAQKSKE